MNNFNSNYEEIKQEFFEFLKENNCYELFIENLKKNGEDFEKWIYYNNYMYFIIYAFQWIFTKQGYLFWNKIHNKWLKKIKKRG